jgi:hypothetical protein
MEVVVEMGDPDQFVTVQTSFYAYRKTLEYLDSEISYFTTK